MSATELLSVSLAGAAGLAWLMAGAIYADSYARRRARLAEAQAALARAEVSRALWLSWAAFHVPLSGFWSRTDARLALGALGVVEAVLRAARVEPSRVTRLMRAELEVAIVAGGSRIPAARARHTRDFIRALGKFERPLSQLMDDFAVQGPARLEAAATSRGGS